MKIFMMLTVLLALVLITVDLGQVRAQQRPNFMYQTDAGRREQAAIRDKQALKNRWTAAHCSLDWKMSRSKCQFCASIRRQMRDLHQRMTGVFANARVQTRWPDAERRWYRYMKSGHKMKWNHYQREYDGMARKCAGM